MNRICRLAGARPISIPITTPKSESTGNTNFDLNRRASLRPYLREAGGAIPSAYSPGITASAALAALDWRALTPQLGHTALQAF